MAAHGDLIDHQKETVVVAVMSAGQIACSLWQDFGRNELSIPGRGSREGLLDRGRKVTLLSQR